MIFMADETPRRLRRFDRKGEMPPSYNNIPESESKKGKSTEELFSKKPSPEKSYDEEEDEMAEQLAEESAVEEIPVKSKKDYEEDKEGIIDALGKKSEEDVHEELAQQELDKFKQKFKRMPKSEQDYNAIAESIFEQVQLKGEGEAFGHLSPVTPEEPKEFGKPEEKAEDKSSSSGRKIRRRGRQAEEEYSQEQQSSVAIAKEESEDKGSVSDLFGSSKKGKKKSSSDLDELGGDEDMDSDLGEEDKGDDDLADLGSLEGKEESGKEEDLSLDNMDEDKEDCPNCEKPTDEVIYCSSCGAAFCDSCAKAKEKYPDKVKYTCPHCGVKIDKAIKK